MPQSRAQPALGPLRVFIDVLLAGELHQLVHDLVGHRPQHDPVLLQAVVPGEIERLAEPHTGPDRQPGRQLARRLEFKAADHRGRDDRGSRFESKPGHARLAAVEPPIRSTRALGIDAEQFPCREHAQPGAQRPFARLPAGAIDRDLADAAEERLAQQPFQPSASEIFGFRQEDHLARQRQRRKEVIGERQMVASQDGRAVPRHVVGALRPRAEHQPQERAQYRLDHPVEHGHMFPRQRPTGDHRWRAGC